MLTLDVKRLGRVQPWLDGYVTKGRLAGGAVLIRQHGVEALFVQSGQRDFGTGAEFGRETVARIYSMTKPITSLVLMMLVEEGKVHLDAPVSHYLPSFAAPVALRPDATDITQTHRCPVPTLHQLLTHRSGLSYPFNPGLVPAAMAELDLMFKPTAGTLAEQCDVLAKLPLAFVPGARWEYSVGIDVIGRVIEVVTGQSLDIVFQERVFEPLGMADTFFVLPDRLVDRFAALYTPLSGDAMDLNAGGKSDDGVLRVADTGADSVFRRTTCFSGGGGLLATIDDYMIFTEALRARGKSLVSPSTASFMMANHLPGDIASLGPASFAEQPMEGMGFGIGGAVVIDPPRSRVPASRGDFSWGGMASTFFWVDQKHSISAVLFTQLSPSSSYPLRAELKALVHGALM